MTAQSKLDAEELLHLSIRASQQSQHETAINHLKQALELEPKNAKIHYMLGAEHAEIGLYDRAAQEMAKAVELDPNLVTALFQLGLLHITSGRVAEAEQVWSGLDKLGKNHFLYLFKAGMLHLARDEFDPCIEALEKGLAANRFNDALNKDMQRILNEVRQRFGDSKAAKPAAAPASPEQKAKVPKHVVLSAYRESRNDKEKE